VPVLVINFAQQNKDGEPQWDLKMNPRKLNNIIVWPGKNKEK
jgi:hypothetical protein